MEEYPSNSNKSKEPQEIPEVTQITSEPASIRKKSVGKKFGETFFKGNATGVWKYLAASVLVPRVQDLLADMARQGVEKMLYGEPRSTGRYGNQPTNNGRVNYSVISSGGRTASSVGPRTGPSPSQSPSIASGFQEILFHERGQAELVRDFLFDRLEQYGAVSVKDLKDAVGITSEYTDMNYGWRDLRGTDLRSVHDGWVLVTPKPEPIAR